METETSNTIAIIDYGIGNTYSVYTALKKLDYTVLVTNNKTDIENADALIIPGVGSFGEAMKNLHIFKLIDLLNHEVLENKKPVLGICLGMQIFADRSEEDKAHPGLGWIKGEVLKINPANNYRVPQVGWNNLELKNNTPLFNNCTENSHFYFDHSYHYACDDSMISSVCNYGDKIVASVQHKNIYGVQFHPEKSQTNGLKLFRSFFNHYNLKAEQC
jgi:imidazole glycerol-phosphate synthase subunit HisH